MASATNSQEPAALVLVVDDAAFMRHMLRDILTGAGYAVMTAVDGATAIPMAQEHSPDLVILNARLPGQNGYEVCQRLKEDERTRYAAVILVSAAHFTMADRARGLEAGGDDYLTVPFANQELLARMQAHLRAKRATDELRLRQRELEAIKRQLLALQTVGASVAAALSLDELLHRVADSIVQGLGYKYAVLVLVEEEQKRLTLGTISGLSLPLLEQLESVAGIDLARLALPLDQVDNPALRAMRAGEVFVTRDATRVCHPPLEISVCATIQEMAQMTAMATLPLMSRDRLVGGILVVSEQPVFSPSEIDVLRALAAQAAVAIDAARLRVSAVAAEDRASLLLDIQSAIAARLETAPILTLAIAGAVRAVNATSGLLMLLDAETREVTNQTGFGLPAIVDPSQPCPDLKSGIFDQVITTGHSVRVNDTHSLASPDPWISLLGLRSVVVVPIRRGTQAIGVLSVHAQDDRPFTGADENLLMAIADQVAVAIEQTRLYEQASRRAREEAELNLEAQQRVQELALLNEVAAAVGESLDLDTVLEQALSYMRDLTQADRVAAYLREHDAPPVFRLWATQGYSQNMIGVGQWVPATDPFGETMPQKITMVYAPSPVDRQIGLEFPQADYLETQGLASIILVPLRTRGSIIGSVHLLFTSPREPSVSTWQLLDTISHQVSVAIENARLYQETRRLAITDGLTGLYNYRHFYVTLGQEIARSRRYDSPLALIMLDVDDFKEYNDAHGHLAGDDLLVDLTHLIRDQVRSVDMAARYGGEEIAILLPETDKWTARQVAERIRQSVATHVFVARETQDHAQITVSAGVATFPDDAEEPRDLVHAVDMALYVAKRAGKNCVRVAGAQESMNEE